MGFHFTMPINSKDKAKEPTRLLRPWDSPGRNTGVGLPCPSPGDLPNPGIEPGSPALRADALPSEPPGKPYIKYIYIQLYKIYPLKTRRYM